MINIAEVKFNNDGLVPVIVQDEITKDVLMLAYMNEEALRMTVETSAATYYSRSRQQLWEKGETSGNTQLVKEIYYDCDRDTILLMVEQIGVACHNGTWSCFEGMPSNEDVLAQLFDVIQKRKQNPKEGSYTTYLFDKGIDKILKKVGEETSEVIIGAKNEGIEELIYEISDLVYHTLVLMVEKGVTVAEIKEQLAQRREKVEA